MKTSIKEGGIYFCDLNPVKGSEQGQRRPVLIVSNNRLNSIGSLVFIVPITNTNKDFPLHVKLPVGNLRTTGKVLCDQVRTIDSSVRELEFVEFLDDETLTDVMETVKAMLI